MWAQTRGGGSPVWVLVLAGGSGQGGWAGRGCLGLSSRAVAKMPWLMRGGMVMRARREERLVVMSVLDSCGVSPVRLVRGCIAGMRWGGRGGGLGAARIMR